MAIIGQISREELGTRYTHYGWFCGLCPVYLADLGSEGPTVVERNWVPSWWMGIVEWLFGQFIFVNSLLDPEYEPMFPIAISGKINRSSTKAEKP